MAAALAERAEQVVSGGDLLLHCGDESMMWKPNAITGPSIEAQLRNYDGRVLATSLKDLEVNNKNNHRKLEREADAAKDPAFVRRTPGYQNKADFYERFTQHDMIRLAREVREKAYELLQKEKAAREEAEAKAAAEKAAEEEKKALA